MSEGYKLRSDEQILETQSGNKFFFLCLNFSSLCLNSQDSVKLENNDSLQHLNLKDLLRGDQDYFYLNLKVKSL